MTWEECSDGDLTMILDLLDDIKRANRAREQLVSEFLLDVEDDDADWLADKIESELDFRRMEREEHERQAFIGAFARMEGGDPK